ncbi:MAG: hypothetical protein JWM89_1314 [Acidimicrobiales bacterium]|nr:hypothetical protein [Acidimicrobiales bacterium]
MPVQHNRSMVSMPKAHREAGKLLAILESASSARVPAERQTHCVTALAAVARARSLLIGTVALDEAGRADLLGITVRALLEVWYFGVVALLGDDADLQRLEDDHRYWKNALAEALPGVEPDPGSTATFSVFARATRADELLLSIGEPAGLAVEWYRELYAGESLSHAHAGIESLSPYVVEAADGSVAIEAEPEVDEGLRYGRIRVATILTALLAKWTWERVGLDAAAFDELAGE